MPKQFSSSGRGKAKPGRKGPKSYKADGTPKQRWSSAERSERGHSKRRGGGRPRTQREFGEERNSGSRYPGESRYSRDSRYSGDSRSERHSGDRRGDASGFDSHRESGSYRKPESRGNYGSRDERPGSGREKFGSKPRRDVESRSESRPWSKDARGRSFARFDPPRADAGDPRGRDDRRQNFRGDDFRGDDFRGADFRGEGRYGSRREERGYHPARPTHNEPDHGRPKQARRRPEFGSGDDRGRSRFDRNDRFDKSERFDRSDRFERNDRPERRFENNDRFEKKDRFERNDRKDRFDRSDRFERKDRFLRDDRGQDRHHDRREADEAHESDQMSWEASEIDTSDVDLGAISDDTDFAALGVPKAMVAALAAQGITKPFPIQAATIPDALQGRDVLGRGQTGSGKTLGFGLPMISRLAHGDASADGAPGGVVLVPTRELALQVADVLAPLAKAVGLSVILVAGGMAFGPQLKAFDRGVDIVVATPGRLIDLMEQGAANLSKVQVTVLDEADHMADLGFMPEVTTILDAIPADGQRLLFSATLDRGVDRLVQKYLHDPVTHEVDSAKASVTTMEHQVLHVLPHDKNAATAAVANRPGRTVVFVRTQRGADRVAEQLREAGVMAGSLHGGLTQGARARMLGAFKGGDVPVLVATDVAARGIHVDDISLVLQVDPPMGPKEYLHRSGRTARAGEKGVVCSIVLPHQRKEMRRITGQAGVRVEPIEVRPGDGRLEELTGARVPEGPAIDEESFRVLIAPKREARSSRPRPRRKAWGRDEKDSRGRGGRRRDDRRGPRG